MTAPLVRLRSLSEGQNQWLSSSPGHAGVPSVTFMFVRSATPHLSAAAEQQSRQPDDVGGYAPRSSRVSGCAAERRSSSPSK